MRPRITFFWKSLLVVLLANHVNVAGVDAVQVDPKPDVTGMAPGDIVLGNMNTYPGHMGIYIGKWEDLPTDLQSRYSKAFDEMLVRSSDVGLKKSFLVVDSDSGRGSRVTSFVEQFTGYLPKMKKTPNLKGALQWESKQGGAVQWSGLPQSDKRRWAIVEESLKAAAARVPYDDAHYQWETTKIGGGNEYKDMKGMDCTAMVHVAYYRGAQIDLDVSVFPWHDPQQLYEEAKSENLLRANVDLNPVFIEAAIIGNWQMSLRTIKSGSEFKLNGDAAVNIHLNDGQLVLTRVDETSFKPVANETPVPVPVTFTPHQSGDLEIAISDRKLTAPYSKVSIRVTAENKFQASFAGTDSDGPFELSITGTKIFQKPK